jgi:hypothetical protein
MIYYAAYHSPIYIAPGTVYRCTAKPGPSDCVWMVPGILNRDRVCTRSRKAPTLPCVAAEVQGG